MIKLSDIVKIEATADRSCLVCSNRESAHLNKISIMRTIRNENIISFTICDECLGKAAHDLIEHTSYGKMEEG